MKRAARCAALALAALAPWAQAAELDGRALSSAGGAWWALPFAGMLLSIALLPLLAPHFWHRHFGKVALGWALAFALPSVLAHGAAATGGVLLHMLWAEYIPFIVLLTALFTVSGGIYVRGNLHGSPALNTGLLALGAVLASIMGTTGASMLLIRPLIRANDNRRHTVHIWVFFIFIVSNIGGSLTPLGDPPLFLGFLQGVSFFWTLKTLLPETLFCVAVLLALFWLIDRHWYGKEGVLPRDPTPDDHRFGLDGGINLLLLAGVVGLVLLSGTWKPGIVLQLPGADVALQNLLRDAALVGVTLASIALTPRAAREANQFGWGPMQEVAKLFIGIFVTMLPVLAMLRAGHDGAFAAVLRAVTGPDGQPLPWAYFWASGLLSSFLDNAPTYLVFFNLAGGDVQQLMGPLAATLAAISAGSVFMGANSYIGNAPNFMVKAIVEDRGLRMPSFFGYMGWSFGILVPLFVVVTFIWMR
ncbi:sodium:proton antiporter [Aquabacterium sp. OR-4]|uniref:sodium:proton antiporter n=1 Tax=Aquabacterium sp. OR-4 TaxID=2978127 RepID=UPI0021B3EF15|nr:sodium:proton antiporter [Aquabacterium sp. OR-4]MDT7835167.1 sodium:proton antiporter [Aquabacterium sp. OR-4]